MEAFWFEGNRYGPFRLEKGTFATASWPNSPEPAIREKYDEIVNWVGLAMDERSLSAKGRNAKAKLMAVLDGFEIYPVLPIIDAVTEDQSIESLDTEARLLFALADTMKKTDRFVCNFAGSCDAKTSDMLREFMSVNIGGRAVLELDPSASGSASVVHRTGVKQRAA